MKVSEQGVLWRWLFPGLRSLLPGPPLGAGTAVLMFPDEKIPISERNGLIGNHGSQVACIAVAEKI